MATHESMRLQRLGSMVIVQPFSRGAVAGPSLTVDLTTGSVALAEHPVVDKDYSEVQGVLGLLRLTSCAAMVVVTAAEQVAVLRGAPVYKVTGTEVLSALRVTDPDDRKYLALLGAGTEPTGVGRTMYFSRGTDITLTTQRAADTALDPSLAGKPAVASADPRFFWNKALAAPLLEGSVAGCDRFVLLAMVGFVKQLDGVRFRVKGQQVEGSFTLIARRSRFRAGTRFWRRGIDAQGNVANSVESEQLLQLPSLRAVSSYVQTRGSMPVLWSQAPNIKYKPPTYIAPLAACQGPFEQHVAGLLEAYGEAVGINLANQHGSEGKLGATYAALATRYSATDPRFRIVAFDFHKECGATNYARLSLLWSQIDTDLARFGYYLDSPSGGKRQVGVLRTNCVDSLDRTNVVQGMLGRKQLEAVLAQCGALGAGETLASAYPEFDYLFKNVWADHGDEVSCQYAGTGALKSQFTRTGTRDARGLADDGWKSGVRYVKNNFYDGAKQDALDLVTAAHRVDPGHGFHFKPQASAAVPLTLALLAFYVAFHNLSGWKQDNRAGNASTAALVQGVGLPLALGVALFVAVSRFGRKFVNTPQLRPDLVQVWLAKEGKAE